MKLTIFRTYQSEWRGSVQDNDVEIDVTIAARWCKPDRETGHAGGWEDIEATDEDGNVYDLTPREDDEAIELLNDDAAERKIARDVGKWEARREVY